MVTVGPFHVQQYRQNERYPVRWLVWSLIVSAAAGSEIWLVWSLYHIVSGVGTAFLAVGAVSGLFAACGVSDKLKNGSRRFEENGPEYRMVALWVRCGRNLNSFPFTAPEKLLWSPWAEKAVTDAAEEVIIARNARDAFDARTAKFRTMDTQRRINAYYDACRRHDQKVAGAEERFADVWELVTEEGIGILRGGDWSDREQFLERLIWKCNHLTLEFVR